MASSKRSRAVFASLAVGAATILGFGLTKQASIASDGGDRGVRLYFDGNSESVTLVDGAVGLAISLFVNGGVANPSDQEIVNRANVLLDGTGFSASLSDVAGIPGASAVESMDFDGNGVSAEITDGALILAQALFINGGVPSPTQSEILNRANTLLTSSGLPTIASIGDGADVAGPGAPPFPGGGDPVELNATVEGRLAGEIRIEVADNPDLPDLGQGFSVAAAENGNPSAQFVRIATIPTDDGDVAIFAAALEQTLADNLDLSQAVPEAAKPSAFKQIADFDSVTIPGVSEGGSAVRVILNGTDGTILGEAN